MAPRSRKPKRKSMVFTSRGAAPARTRRGNRLGLNIIRPSIGRGAELKDITTTFTADPNTTGTVQNLTAIAQGLTDATRIGNVVTLKKILLSGTVSIHASAAHSEVRMVIVQAITGTTSQPVITDLWSSVNFFVNNGLQTINSQLSREFRIIWDRHIVVSSNTNQIFAFKLQKRLNHKVVFTGAGATDEGIGHFYLFMGSNEATNDPDVSAAVTLQYADA